MLLHHVYSREDNHIVGAQWQGDALRVSLKDGRIVLMPGAWFTWLDNQPASVRENFTVKPWSVDWPDVDDGFSIETVLLGRPGPLPPVDLTSDDSAMKSVSMTNADWGKIQAMAEQDDISVSRWMQYAAIEKAARQRVTLTGTGQHGGKRR